MYWRSKANYEHILCSDCECVIIAPNTCRKCYMSHHDLCKCPAKSHGYIFDVERYLNEKKILKIADFKEKYFHEIRVPPQKKCHVCKRPAQEFYGKCFCKKCFKRVKKNQFCPVCMVTYSSKDYDVDMMACDFCLRWLHYDCDPKTKQLKPDKDDYKCVLCYENDKNFIRLKRELAKDRFIFGINGPSRDTSCIHCKKPTCDSKIFSIRPVGDYGHEHLICNDYSDKKCAICDKDNPTVSCHKCEDVFHVDCSDGVFRQGTTHPTCNYHFKMNFRCKKKEEKSKPCDFLLNGDVIYGKNLLRKNFVFDGQVFVLEINSNGFFCNGKRVNLTRFKAITSINIKGVDIFRFESKQFKFFRKTFKKNKVFLCIVKKAMKILELN